MVVLAFIVSCIALPGLARLAKDGSRSRVRTAEVPADADRVQGRWTSLDDRHLTRLLDDNAPC